MYSFIGDSRPILKTSLRTFLVKKAAAFLPLISLSFPCRPTLCVFYHSSTHAQMSESNEVIVQYILRIVVAVVEWNLSLPLLPEKGLSCVMIWFKRAFDCG